MGGVKKELEKIVELLVKEYCRRNKVKENQQLFDAALNFILYGPKPNNPFNADWVKEILSDN